MAEAKYIEVYESHPRLSTLNIAMFDLTAKKAAEVFKLGLGHSCIDADQLDTVKKWEKIDYCVVPDMSSDTYAAWEKFVAPITAVHPIKVIPYWQFIEMLSLQKSWGGVVKRMVSVDDIRGKAMVYVEGTDRVIHNALCSCGYCITNYNRMSDPDSVKDIDKSEYYVQIYTDYMHKRMIENVFYYAYGRLTAGAMKFIPYKSMIQLFMPYSEIHEVSGKYVIESQKATAACYQFDSLYDLANWANETSREERDRLFGD